jgi:hypothetical protein
MQIRPAIRWGLRGILAALLALALLDPALPGSGPRLRVYLIDASASVAPRPAVDAFTPADALRVVEHDIRRMRSDDRIAVLAFGARPVVLVPLMAARDVRLPIRIEGVDPQASDLASALEAARSLAEGGEIVLFTDARPTGGPIAPEKIRVPVHPFALGPLGSLDAAIRAIDAPSSVPPGTAFKIRVTIEATGSWKGELIAQVAAKESIHSLDFMGAGLQDVVLEAQGPPPGVDAASLTFRLRSAASDACPENDTAAATVWAATGALRVLVVNSTGASALPPALAAAGYAARVARDLQGTGEADLVLIERLRADAVPPADLDRLAREVREGRVGLVALGGSQGFALGGWATTPIEKILPFWAYPDERSAVVVALDKSGSMAEPSDRPRLHIAAEAVRRAIELTHDDDELGLVAFAAAPEIRLALVPGRERDRAAGALRGIVAGGSTAIAPALRTAAALVRTSKAGRRRIVLVTDGESVREEEALEAAARELAQDRIGVTIVRTGEQETDALKILVRLGAEVIDAHDFDSLDAKVSEALVRSRELTAAPEAAIRFSGPLEGLAEAPKPGRVNRASPKAGAEVAARAGDLPVAAFASAGRGRTAALTLALEEGWAGALAAWPGWGSLLARCVEGVVPSAPGLPAEVSARFEGDRLVLSASVRSSDRPDRIEAKLEGEPLILLRRGENWYEASLPWTRGSATLRIGDRIAAVANRPHPPEYSRVGPDEGALDRIAQATGGNRLFAPKDLEALPGRGPSDRRSARPLLLAAALAVFLLEIAAGVLLK